ncbi:Long-chain-fatty-acid--CoA ligase [Rhodococcus erythropolis]|uniref:long-chain-fatty-acid--CoA ligase n=1 Tax=Rhodococcus erythropolis TaxID=1833 RepID=UPI0015553CCC|nr:long-chain-fatty-acid--CoA ligase [Rhodococcus erythropolis]PBI91947.1 Long-chain-fatty-acid--CoA ligase [Rhodococcus erythropolis]
MTTTWTEQDDIVFPSTMMDEPLLLKSIVERAETMFGDQILVSYNDEGPTETTYRDLTRRVRQLASALVRQGVGVGDRVATFAWNTREHLELYLAVPSIGAVLHPLNIRLHKDELEYIIDHAGDSVVVTESSLADRLPTLRSDVKSIIIGPATPALPDAVDYEQFVDSGDPEFGFPRIPDRSASTICYTSGTTGKPKGVVYSHRSTVLNTLLESLPDYYAISEADVVLPFVPMFHANAWGLPYSTLMAGARLVLPGSRTAPEAIAEMLAEQRVTFSAAVPTVWHAVGDLQELPDLSSIRMIVAGGAPLSEAFLARFDELGLHVVQGYGMTETNPFLSIGFAPAGSTASNDTRTRLRLSQGRPIPFAEVRIDEANGGELQLRGATVTARYYNAPAESAEKFTDDGWMRTGDIAEIDTNGIIRIVDRTKDMVKSGGEWIPSIELENAILSHPAIVEAVVVAISDDRWGERPGAFVVRQDERSIDEKSLREHLEERVAKWWIPEFIQFTDALPKTSVGKLDKKAMRIRAAEIIHSNA